MRGHVCGCEEGEWGSCLDVVRSVQLHPWIGWSRWEYGKYEAAEV